MKKIIKLFKNHSPYLVFLTLAEICLSVICTLSFVYTDKLSYADSELIQTLGIEKLLENIYSSTWWALILLLLAFIAIFSLATMIYKKMDYLFISISCWFVMLILAINLNNTLIDNLSILMIGIPIILINAIAYKTEKKILNKKKTKEEEKNKITKVDCIGYSLMVLLIIAIMLLLINTFGKKPKKEIDEKTTTTTTQVITTTTKKIKKASKK